jgi:hypothetical protein
MAVHVNTGAGCSQAIWETMNGGTTWDLVADGCSLRHPVYIDGSQLAFLSNETPIGLRLWNGTSVTTFDWTSPTDHIGGHARALSDCGPTTLCLAGSSALHLVSKTDLSQPISGESFSDTVFGVQLSDSSSDYASAGGAIIFSPQRGQQGVFSYNGSAWNNVRSAAGAPSTSFLRVFSPPDGGFLAYGGSGFFSKSIDLASWSRIGVPSDSGINSFHATSAGLVARISGNEYRSTDGGTTYSLIVPPSDVRTAQWGVVDGALLARGPKKMSFDAGLTWISIGIPSPEIVSGLVRVGSTWYVSTSQTDSGMPSLQRLFRGSSLASLTESFVPVASPVHASRALALPAGAPFPLGTLKFAP